MCGQLNTELVEGESLIAETSEHHTQTLVFIDYVGFCALLLNLFETVGLHVTKQNFRKFSFSNIDFKHRNIPSPRCATAANAIDNDIDIY